MTVQEKKRIEGLSNMREELAQLQNAGTSRGMSTRECRHRLGHAWTSGLDYWEKVMSDEERAFSINRSAWQADLEDVNDLLAEAHGLVRRGDAGAMTRLLETRLSKMRLTPLHYACLGARSMSPNAPHSRAKFVSIVAALCDAGARVDARDIGGCTPLGVAAAQDSTDASLRIVQLLAGHGVNPSIRTRFGESLLVPTIMGRNEQAFRALLRVGADLTIADFNGTSPADQIVNIPSFLRTAADENKAAPPLLSTCEACGKEKSSKRCGRCRVATYCTRGCQVQAWRAGRRDVCQLLE